MATPGPIKLSILTFPQEFVLDPAPAIIANVLLIPRYDPLISLVPEIAGIPSFAVSNLILHAGLVKGNDQLPKLGDGAIIDLGLPGMNDRTAFFNTLKTKFSIDDSLPRLNDKPTKGYTAATHIKKYLSQRHF